MEDNLISQLEETEKKSFAGEPSFKEANITFLGIMLLSIATISLMVLLNGLWSVGAYITIAVLSFIAIIPFFVAGYQLSKKHKHLYKFFYYLNFLSSTISVMMSVLAILKHLDVKIELLNMSLLSAGFLFVAVLQFVIISAGKRERLFFSLTGLFYLAFIIWGAVLLSDGNRSVGIPMLIYASSYLFIWLAMLVYIASGDSFFPAMSSTYLIIAMIALAVAVTAIAKDCSCEGGFCDTAPSFGGGGRRAKAEKLSKITKRLK